jgi:glutamyl/glutaminyl-tRNA synthetase
VPAAVDFLIQDEFSYDEEAVAKVRANAQLPTILMMLGATFSVLSEWSADAAKQTLGEVAKEAGAKAGQLMFPLRVALSGRPHGPDLGDILNLLGRERCVTRLNRFTNLLTS